MGVLGPHVVGATPKIDDPFLRHGRYYKVLRHREMLGLPEPPWMAIDDEPGRHPSHLRNLALTDPAVGFAVGNAVRLRRLLGEC